MITNNSSKSLKKIGKKFHKRKYCLLSCIEKLLFWKENYKLRKYEKYPHIKEICLNFDLENREELYKKLEKEVDKIILIDHLYLRKKGEIINSDSILVENLLGELEKRLKKGHSYLLIRRSFLNNLKKEYK